jgi:hypothetical protein
MVELTTRRVAPAILECLAYFEGFTWGAAVIFYFGCWLRRRNKVSQKATLRHWNYQFQNHQLLFSTALVACFAHVVTHTDAGRLPIGFYAVVNATFVGYCCLGIPASSNGLERLAGNAILLCGVIGLVLIQSFLPEFRSVATHIGTDALIAQNIALVIAFGIAVAGAILRSGAAGGRQL